MRNGQDGNEQEDRPIIARRWRGKVRAIDHDAYLRYVEQTGVAALRTTPGNEGVVIYRHLDRDAAMSEIEVVSLWRDHSSIVAFAGDDISIARFFPEDDNYLIYRDLTVRHDDVDIYIARDG